MGASKEGLHGRCHWAGHLEPEPKRGEGLRGTAQGPKAQRGAAEGTPCTDARGPFFLCFLSQAHEPYGDVRPVPPVRPCIYASSERRSLTKQQEGNRKNRERYKHVGKT